MQNFAQQIIVTQVALLGSADVQGPTEDMERLGSFNVSVLVTRDSADTDVDIEVEDSFDGTAFRLVELTNLAVSAGTPTQEFDKEYPLNRKFMRVKITNKTANDLSVTEVIVLKKAIYGRGT